MRLTTSQIRFVAIVALSVFALAGAACGASGPVSEFSQTYTAAPGATLVIDNDNGSTTITADDSASATREVRVYVRFEGADDIDFRVTEGSDEFKIVANSKSHGLFSRSPKADITVIVPADMPVNAGSGNGSVTVSGMETSNIRVSTGNGAVTLESMHAAVSATTGNGSITVRDAAGSFNLTTGNGTISVDGELDTARENRMQTGNGSVTVALSGELNLTVDAKSDNGKVNSSLPLQETEIESGRVRGRAGDGSATLTVRSGNGTITLRTGG